MNLEIPGDYRRPVNREHLADLIDVVDVKFNRVKREALVTEITSRAPVDNAISIIDRVILPRLLDARDKLNRWHVVDVCVHEVDALVRESEPLAIPGTEGSFRYHMVYSDYFCAVLGLRRMINDLQWQMLRDANV